MLVSNSFMDYVIAGLSGNAIMLMTCVLTLSVALSLWSFYKLRVVEKKWHDKFERLLNDVNSTSSGSMGMGRRLIEVEKKLTAVAQQKEEQANGYTPYTLATEMLGVGADIEAVISDCGISRAEAELMQLMHKQMKRCGPAQW